MPKIEILIFDSVVSHCPRKYRDAEGHTLPAQGAPQPIGHLCRTLTMRRPSREDTSSLKSQNPFNVQEWRLLRMRADEISGNVVNLPGADFCENQALLAASVKSRVPSGWHLGVETVDLTQALCSATHTPGRFPRILATLLILFVPRNHARVLAGRAVTACIDNDAAHRGGG